MLPKPEADCLWYKLQFVRDPLKDSLTTWEGFPQFFHQSLHPKRQQRNSKEINATVKQRNRSLIHKRLHKTTLSYFRAEIRQSTWFKTSNKQIQTHRKHTRSVLPCQNLTNCFSVEDLHHLCQPWLTAVATAPPVRISDIISKCFKNNKYFIHSWYKEKPGFI